MAIWEMNCLYVTFVQYSKAVILLHFYANNTPNLSAEKRKRSCVGSLLT